MIRESRVDDRSFVNFFGNPRSPEMQENRKKQMENVKQQFKELYHTANGIPYPQNADFDYIDLLALMANFAETNQAKANLR